MSPIEAKRDLPNVLVKIGRNVLTGRVSGRLNPLATVTVDYVTNGKRGEHLRGAPWVDFQFSWKAIAHAATNGTALIAD